MLVQSVLECINCVGTNHVLWQGIPYRATAPCEKNNWQTLLLDLGTYSFIECPLRLCDWVTVVVNSFLILAGMTCLIGGMSTKPGVSLAETASVLNTLDPEWESRSLGWFYLSQGLCEQRCVNSAAIAVRTSRQTQLRHETVVVTQ